MLNIFMSVNDYTPGAKKTKNFANTQNNQKFKGYGFRKNMF